MTTAYDRAMNADSRSIARNAAPVGTLLREWRTARRLSQLDLALDVGVSARHLSFVETGRSQPSRDLVERLADALEMPLRERNALAVAAGFAPQYRETALTTPEMAPVTRAIETILAHQEPYPAIVMNRHWDVLMVNDAVLRIFGRLKRGGPKHPNVMRQVFDPDDMRAVVGNWEEVAGDLIRHLHNEVATSPSDARLRALLDEVLAAPGVPQSWRKREPGASPAPMLTTIFRSEDLELHFFSTLTTFGTTRDVTLDELRIECMFPVDEATAEKCHEIAATEVRLEKHANA
jgi:transcriptional regulator with XRE-family HTH domain